MATSPIYQFYAELCDYTPKMWRRFQVLSNMTMARLGYILMTMFEMQAGHLFCFDVPHEENFRLRLRERYTEEEVIDLFGEMGSLSEEEENQRYEIMMQDEAGIDAQYGGEGCVAHAAQAKLRNVIGYPNEQMTFTYDYGDDWTIRLVLEEEIVDKELPGKELPRVLAGEGYGIVEDCGGVPGLENLAKAFNKEKRSAIQ